MPEFTPLELLYVCSFIIGVLHFHAGTRQRMMIMKFAACVFSSFYFFILGADTAMIAAMIAGLGGLFQACFNDARLAQTKALRISVAVMLAGLSMLLCAGSTVEALPLVAVINARLVETQSCRQRIRVGYLLSSVCWVSYAASTGLIVVYVIENLNLLSNLLAIWKEHRKRKKAVPVPIHTA